MGNNRLTWPLAQRRPVSGELSQGAVFSCARAEDYDKCSVFGLVITARCDIAQDKAKIYSYLPVVSLRDWWHVDGADIVIKRAQAQQLGSLRSALKDSGFAESILGVHSPNAVADVLFPADASGLASKHRSRVLKAVESLGRLAALQPALSTDDLRQLCREHQQIRRVVMDELLAGRLTGFSFLPQLEHDGADDGFVVLLREVRHLPRTVARQVSIGLPKPIDPVAARALEPHIAFDTSEFAMPIGVVPSPLIVQIMQTFGTLFLRIGLDDLPTDYRQTIWDRQQLDPAVQS